MLKKIKNIIIIFLLLIIIYLYKYNRKNDLNICLCAIVKNENLYIREFIEHYKKIGYNKIFLYDNNDKNGENIEEFIKEYINNGFVEIIEFHERSSREKPQFEAYKDCYLKYNKLYDWLSFYDVDEFLVINKKYRFIQDFLNDKIFQKCQNIKINWLWYYDKNTLFYENKPIQDRIKKIVSNNTLNRHIKSTVRGNLSTNYWKKMINPHTSKLNYTSCSSSGKIIKFDSPYNNPPDYTNAKLKHYSIKSFEEYCYKLKRGRSDYTQFANNKLIKNSYKQLISENIKNIKKINIIHKIFNNSIINSKILIKKMTDK